MLLYTTIFNRYATVDFVGVTSPGNFCRRQASMSIENGASCYRGLGLTQDCARIWDDTSWNTATKCFGACVLDPTIPIFNTNVGSFVEWQYWSGSLDIEIW